METSLYTELFPVLSRWYGEDVAQEAFTRLLTHPEVTNPPHWLKVTAKNLFLMEKRRTPVLPYSPAADRRYQAPSQPSYVALREVLATPAGLDIAEGLLGQSKRVGSGARVSRCKMRKKLNRNSIPSKEGRT